MRIPIAPIQSRWQRSQLAETVASDRVSAACYRRSENIDVLAVVVAELKFRDVQRQIFAAYPWITACASPGVVIAVDRIATTPRIVHLVIECLHLAHRG